MVVGTSVNFLELENSLEGTNHSQTPPLLTSKEERWCQESIAYINYGNVFSQRPAPYHCVD